MTLDGWIGPGASISTGMGLLMTGMRPGQSIYTKQQGAYGAAGTRITRNADGSLTITEPGAIPYTVQRNAANRTLTAAEQQKSHHIFGQDKHKMGPLVDRFGTREQAYLELDAAAQLAYRNGDLNLSTNGINTETRISVGGVEVDLVGGRVVDGNFVLGSASRREVP